MEPLVITTERLQIRNLCEADLIDFHFYRSNPEVTKYQGFNVMDMEQAKSFIISQQNRMFGNAGEWVQYAIADKETARLVGDCAIKLDAADVSIAETGITISHTQQQKGFGKEAMKGILKYLFTIKNLHRVFAITDEENTASVNMLKAAGFRLEGHFIENTFFKGRWSSEYQFALLQREWHQKQINI